MLVSKQPWILSNADLRCTWHVGANREESQRHRKSSHRPDVTSVKLKFWNLTWLLWSRSENVRKSFWQLKSSLTFLSIMQVKQDKININSIGDQTILCNRWCFGDLKKTYYSAFGMLKFKLRLPKYELPKFMFKLRQFKLWRSIAKTIVPKYGYGRSMNAKLLHYSSYFWIHTSAFILQQQIFIRALPMIA